MEQGDIPEDVLRFLTEKIDTVPHLEALLLLFESAPKVWTEEELAVRVYVPPAKAKEILQGLAREGLVRTEPGSPDVYRYDPAWDETGSTMQRVADTYRHKLVRVANFIHSKGSPAVREFARAFQFKKDR